MQNAPASTELHWVAHMARLSIKQKAFIIGQSVECLLCFLSILDLARRYHSYRDMKQ